MNEDKCFEVEIGGRTLVFSTGHLAKQANGAVYACYGDTAVLVTACMEDEPREDVDFFPLIVDYEEVLCRGQNTRRFIKRRASRRNPRF